MIVRVQRITKACIGAVATGVVAMALMATVGRQPQVAFDGFDYPFGTKANTDGWSDAGNTFKAHCPPPQCGNSSPYHPGEDWNRVGANDAGETIYAVGNGRVKRIANLNDRGFFVVIRHDTPKGVRYSVYGHVANVIVRDEATVKRGEPIAQVFNMSSGPHLHLEMRQFMQGDGEGDMYPNDDGAGYYASPAAIDQNGFLDPSNEIEAQRPNGTPAGSLTIVKNDSPDPVSPGGEFSYSLQVTNNTGTDATGAVLTDALPQEVTFVSVDTSHGTARHENGTVTADIGNLAKGSTATVTIKVTVKPTQAGKITNTAKVRSNEHSESSDTEETQISHTAADPALLKSVSPTTVVTGSNATFTVTVRNQGSGAAQNVRVTDTLPAGVSFVSASVSNGGTSGGTGDNRTFSFATLAPGASATISLVAKVNCEVKNGTQITNTATVSSGSPDSNTGNNSASATVTASNPPPAISAIRVSPSSLWPPNHKMVEVRLQYTVTDNCDEKPSVSIAVSSNEPQIGPGGDKGPDWQVLDANRVLLRAERLGSGNGRIYTIRLTATDSAGGSASRTVTVAVPKSQGK